MLASNPVTNPDAIVKIPVLVEKEGDEMSTAFAWRINRQPHLAPRAAQDQQIV